ncbi:ZN526 protein, partial [Steatornis caripensis]|nr:ZN526 protein [Steatornis caripensis]
APEPPAPPRSQCLDCGRLLLSPTELLAHQTQHPRGGAAGPVRYQCGECRALFPSPALCLQHRRSHRRQLADASPETSAAGAEPPAETSAPQHPYECSECGRLFPAPEELLEHQGEHFTATEKESGETPPHDPKPDPP